MLIKCTSYQSWLTAGQNKIEKKEEVEIEKIKNQIEGTTIKAVADILCSTTSRQLSGRLVVI